MEIQELLKNKIESAKKEKLTYELMNLSGHLRSQKRIINKIKELYDIELDKETIDFIENLNLDDYNLIIELDGSGNLGIGTTNPNQKLHILKK